MALLWICLAKVSQDNKIWQGCEYARDAQGAEYICLNKPDYALIMSQYARICLNTPPPLVTCLWVWLSMHQHFWIYLNIFENAWIKCSDSVRALNMHDYLTCLTSFWRCLSLSSEYGTVVYARVTQSSKYVWLWLHTPQ